MADQLHMCKQHRATASHGCCQTDLRRTRDRERESKEPESGEAKLHGGVLCMYYVCMHGLFNPAPHILRWSPLETLGSSHIDNGILS